MDASLHTQPPAAFVPDRTLVRYAAAQGVGNRNLHARERRQREAQARNALGVRGRVSAAAHNAK